MKAAKFLNLLEENGFNFFTGVPCSYFTPLCDLLAKKNTSCHIAAVREDIALGLAGGAYLAGKLPVVYMQNSGIGYCLEAFASLPIIYHIPVLVLVSYRGPEDQGMEEHLVMGEHTEEILRSFKLKYSIFGNPGLDMAEVGKTPDIKGIKEYLGKEELPYFLLVRKGALV
jgi:sulfopyruvate decarboxylase subunit alpha